MILRMFTAGIISNNKTTFYPKNNRTFSDKLAPVNVITRIDTFSTHLRNIFKKRKTNSNLLPYQNNLLATFSKSQDHVIFKADKNLGPCVIERHTYIQRCLKDHLLDSATYQQLTQKEAFGKLTVLKMITAQYVCDLGKDSKQHKKTISFLKQSFETKHPFPKFYITAKVHKTPWTTRPIVSVSGSGGNFKRSCFKINEFLCSIL